MYECKTAKYTMEGPVHLGLLLAGAPEEMLAKFSSFALPLGIAFQIQDDVLGLYGSSDRIGKAQGSDLREGKMTLLNALLLERLSKEERKTFITLLGKGMALTEEDIRHAQEWMEREGVLRDVKDRARQYIIEGREALLTLRGEISDESYDFFSGIAEYMMVREY